MQSNTEASTPGKSTVEFWQEHIKQWQHSGLSQRVYCNQLNISYSTFVYWRGRIQRRSGQIKQRQFLPVEVRQTQQESVQSFKVKLVSGLVISMPCSMGTASLAELIHMLEKPHA
jgi:hypothetical protein